MIYSVEEAQHVRINQDHTITVEYEQPVMARVLKLLFDFFFETNILTE